MTVASEKTKSVQKQEYAIDYIRPTKERIIFSIPMAAFFYIFSFSNFFISRPSNVSFIFDITAGYFSGCMLANNRKDRRKFFIYLALILVVYALLPKTSYDYSSYGGYEAIYCDCYGYNMPPLFVYWGSTLVDYNCIGFCLRDEKVTMYPRIELTDSFCIQGNKAIILIRNIGVMEFPPAQYLSVIDAYTNETRIVTWTDASGEPLNNLGPNRIARLNFICDEGTLCTSIIKAIDSKTGKKVSVQC